MEAEEDAYGSKPAASSPDLWTLRRWRARPRERATKA